MAITPEQLKAKYNLAGQPTGGALPVQNTQPTSNPLENISQKKTFSPADIKSKYGIQNTEDVNADQERQSMIEMGQPVSTEKRFERTGKSEPTPGGSIVRGGLNPLARISENIRRGGEAILNPQKAKDRLGITDDMTREQKKELYFNQENTASPYLGGIEPISNPVDALGVIAELGSYAIGAGALAPASLAPKAIATSLVSQSMKSMGKIAAIEGVAGAIGNVGIGLQGEDITAGGLAKDAAIGFVAGAGLSAVGGSILSRVSKQVGKGAQVFAPNVFAKAMPDASKAVTDEALESMRKGWQETFTATKSISRQYQKLKNKGVDVGEVFARYNIVPDIEMKTGRMNLQTSIGDVDDALGSYYKALDGYIAKFDTPANNVPLKRIQRQIESTIKNSPETVSSGKTQKIISEVKSMIEDWKSTYGDSVTPSQMNEIRKAMNRVWNENANVRGAERAVGNQMRKLLDNVTDDTVRKANKQIGDLIQTLEFLKKNVDQQVIGGGRMTQLMARVLGSLIGTESGIPIIGPAIGSIGGDAFVRMMRMNAFGTAFERKIVQSLQKNRPVLDLLKQATKDADNQAFLQKLLPARGESSAPMITPAPTTFEPQAQQIFNRNQAPEPLGLPAPRSNAQGETIRLGQQAQSTIDQGVAQDAMPRSNFPAEQRMANTLGLPEPTGRPLGQPMRMPGDTVNNFEPQAQQVFDRTPTPQTDESTRIFRIQKEGLTRPSTRGEVRGDVSPGGFNNEIDGVYAKTREDLADPKNLVEFVVPESQYKKIVVDDDYYEIIRDNGENISDYVGERAIGGGSIAYKGDIPQSWITKISDADGNIVYTNNQPTGKKFYHNVMGDTPTPIQSRIGRKTDLPFTDKIKVDPETTLRSRLGKNKTTPIETSQSGLFYKDGTPVQDKAERNFIERLIEGRKTMDSGSLYSDASTMSFEDFIKKNEGYNIDGGGVSDGSVPAHMVVPKDKILPTEADSWATFKNDTTEKFSLDKAFEEVDSYNKKDFMPPLVNDGGNGFFYVTDGHHRVANLIANGTGDIPVYLQKSSLQKIWEKANNTTVPLSESNALYKRLFPEVVFHKEITTPIRSRISSKTKGYKIPTATNSEPLKKQAMKFDSAEEFVKSKIQENTTTLGKNKKVYRGSGKGIGNSTFVKGKYFADSLEFASTFGDDIVEETIPKGTDVFDLDQVKNNINQVLIPDELLLNPPILTQYLIDNGITWTKNTNSRGVEYVNILTPEVKSAQKLVDTARQFEDKSEYLKHVSGPAYNELRDAIQAYKDIYQVYGFSPVSDAWNKARFLAPTGLDYNPKQYSYLDELWGKTKEIGKLRSRIENKAIKNIDKSRRAATGE